MKVTSRLLVLLCLQACAQQDELAYLCLTSCQEIYANAKQIGKISCHEQCASIVKCAREDLESK